MADEDALDRPVGAPKSIYGPDGQPFFFSEPGMDRFVAVVMNLAAEVWSQEERLRAMSAEVDSDADTAARAFIDRVFAPLREPGAKR